MADWNDPSSRRSSEAKEEEDAVMTTTPHQHDDQREVLDEQTKVRLAQQVSRATAPGAIVENNNDRTNTTDAALTKSQSRAEDYWNSRMILKNREDTNRPDNPVLLPNEEDPLDDFHGRMNDFQDEAGEEVKVTDAMMKRKKKTRFIIVIISLAALLATAVAVGLIVGGNAGNGDSGADNNRNSDQSSATNRGLECLQDEQNIATTARSAEIEASIRRAMLLVSSDLTSTINFGRVNQRAAMCWLSNYDSYSRLDGGYQLVERFAVVSIYFHFVENRELKNNDLLLQWNGLSNPGLHTCEWDFISCNGPNQGVTELNLNQMELRNSLPIELALLVNLVSLESANTKLTGQIPSEIILSLTQLEVLRLNTNNIDGTIPSELASLPKLREIDFQDNDLTGSIPVELYTGAPDGAPTALSTLMLDNNQLDGTLPSGLGRATSLETFSVYLNFLSGTVPNLSQLSSLRGINLGQNNLQGSFPNVSLCTNLESLILGSTRVGGTLPSYIWSLTELRYIDLTNTFMSGTIPTEAVQLTGIENLAIGNTELRGSIPSTYGDLTELRYLDVALEQMSGTVPTELGRLTKLTSLAFSGAISGTIPNEICALFGDDKSLKRVRGPCDRCTCCNICEGVGL